MSSVSEFVPTAREIPPLRDNPKSRDKNARTGRVSGRGKWIVAGVALLILAALAWHFAGALFGGHKKAPPPPPVHVARVRQGNVSVMEHTIATVVSPAMVQVNAQVAGKLLTAYFQEGQLVHKGDPLFLIDPQPFQNQLAQARAQLAKDTAIAANAVNDEKRYTTLYSQNAISQQTRDLAITTAQADAATVQADQAAVNIAVENLGYTKILSPIDGKTGPITIQPGNLITVAGTTPLVTITQIRPIKLSFFLPQNELVQIQNQMSAGKLIAIVPMSGAPGGSEKAPVDFVSNVVTANTGTIELRATFPNDDMRLVPGQTVNIAVTMNQLHNALIVARDAVNVGPDSSYIYAVNDQSVVESKQVTVLNDDGVNDAIKGDFKTGEQVITDGQLRVVPGAKVAVQKGGGRHSTAASSDAPQ